MTRTSDITSFTDLRQNLRTRLDRVRETGRPLYITSNGQAEAVVLSPEQYDSLLDKVELLESLAAIDKSLDDIAAGRVRPLREAVREIAAELGAKPER
jgi:antitoxin YefM